MHRIHPEIRKRARQLRRDQTPAEATLWNRLRAGRLNGFKFRRQHPIGPFIADFYYPAGKLVIEVDGGGHVEQIEYDQDRTEWLNSQGIKVIRFTNHDVRYQLEAVLTRILHMCQGDPDG